MYRLLFIASAVLCFASCASQNTKIRPYTEYTSVDSAAIRFVNAEPFVYDQRESKSSDGMVSFLGERIRDISAVLYDDSKVCTGGQVFPIKKNETQQFTIPMGKMVTLMLNTYRDVKTARMWCPNKFSFIPKSGEVYTAKNSLLLESKSVLNCQVRVFDSKGAPVEVIAREQVPILWTQNSPTCEKSELEQARYSKESNQTFNCIIKAGGYSCQSAKVWDNLLLQ